MSHREPAGRGTAVRHPAGRGTAGPRGSLRRAGRSRLSPGAALGLGLCLVFASCATPIKIRASVDPLALLQGGSLVYARLSGGASLDFARLALPPAEARSLAPVLERTRVLALGLGKDSRKEGSKQEARTADFAQPAFQACLLGDFPFRAASLSLGSNPAWKREKASFFNKSLGLRAAVPGPGLVLATSGSLEPLLALARSPGSTPLPEGLSDLASRELLVWVPEPFAGLAASFLGEALDLPVKGLLVAASPAAEGYEAAVVFLMEDAASARMYRPALRLAWYAFARYLFGDEAAGPQAAAFALDGASYRAGSVMISSGELAHAFSKLADLR